MFDAQDLQQTTGPTEASSSRPTVFGWQQVHLLDRLSAVFRHRRLAGAAFVIVVGLMMLQTYSKIPLYRASARVQIQDERTTAVSNLNANDPMFWQDSEQYYNTQYSILRSRGLARRVVQQLQLQNHPLFNGSAPQSRGPLEHRARGAAGARRDGARPVLARQAETADGEARRRRERGGERLISQFLGGVEIVPEKATRLVEIGYVSPDPAFAALAATTLAEEYAQQNLDLRLETINKNLVWLTEEVAKQEKKVTEAEEAMSRYREKQNALSLEDRAEHRRRAFEHAERHGDARADRRACRRKRSYNQLKSIDPKSDTADSFPVIATNPGVIEAKTRLNELAADKARLSGAVPAGAPGSA